MTFWTHVKKSRGCWEWLGCKFTGGYGRVRVSRTSCMVAHRKAWILTNGPIPHGMLVCHKCDNPSCVRPSHLFLGTHADNIHDCMKKNRRVDHSGEKHPMAILDNNSVLLIRAAHADGEIQTHIAKKHGVSPQVINHVVKRKTWRHV